MYEALVLIKVFRTDSLYYAPQITSVCKTVDKKR